MSNGRNLVEVDRTDRTVNVSACEACRDAFAATGDACPACSLEAEDWARIQEGLLPLLGSRYQLKCRLGSGAVGEIYRANDTVLDRDVAIKRVRLDIFVDVAERERMRERTIREAKMAAKLKHPHIVTIHDIIDTPETSFIVMEFIDGSTLASLIKRNLRLDLDETLNVLGPTAQALDCAHENGIVHRDVKPANIMLEGKTGVKVTDFGIAKSESATSLTATGRILGTPNYMSPEQAMGDEDIDGRSDLFALGCVLFECLTGQMAFRGRNLVEVLMAIANEEPAAVDFESIGIHDDIGAIFKRALAKDPSKRFASAVELIDSVRSLPRFEPRSDEASGESKLVAPPPVVTRRELGKTDSFDMRLQGNLKDTSAAELMRDFYGARHTGILHLCRQKIEKRIYFKKGNIVFANSEKESDRLGEFLIASGQLDRATFERASVTMKHARQRFGRALIELGVLSQEELEGAVRRQIEAIIYSVIQWESGGYGFEFLDRPVEEDIVLNLSTAELILGGVRQISSSERIRDMIGDLERVIVPSDDPLLMYQKMTLTTSEGFVFSRVDGSATANDIAAVSPLGDEETLRCLYALVAAGVVKLEHKPDSVEAPSSGKPEPRVAVPKPDVPKSDVLKSRGGERPHVDGEQTRILEDIASKHASLLTANCYELLSVPRDASDNEIRQAYYRMAKKYHPDGHHYPALNDIHGLLEDLFAKITEAYKTLSDAVSRHKHDGELRTGERPKDNLIEEPRTREPEHAPIPPKVTANRQYLLGKNHFDQMRYFDAIQCLRESVRLSPDTSIYRKLLAVCLAKNPKWREEAESHFLEVLKADESDVECRRLLAESYEASNLTSRAIREYETILAYDRANTHFDSELAKGGEPIEGKLERLKSRLGSA